MAMCHSLCSCVMIELHTCGYIFMHTHVDVVEVVEYLRWFVVVGVVELVLMGAILLSSF